jgi:hypothetical protein
MLGALTGLHGSDTLSSSRVPEIRRVQLQEPQVIDQSQKRDKPPHG